MGQKNEEKEKKLYAGARWLFVCAHCTASSLGKREIYTCFCNGGERMCLVSTKIARCGDFRGLNCQKGRGDGGGHLFS